MRPALLLVDLQRDYLQADGLRPSRDALVSSTAELLDGCRELGVPVLHAWTTVHHDDDRMPHWKRQGKRACVAGTTGHGPPPSLLPAAGERIVHKRFFDPFGGDGRLETVLRELGSDTLVVGGLHLHACVRAAALGAYERGLEVVIAEDAVGSDERVHAAETRRWLSGRVATFLPVRRLLELVDDAAVRT
jgi:nicotinamidase-related amidase